MDFQSGNYVGIYVGIYPDRLVPGIGKMEALSWHNHVCSSELHGPSNQFLHALSYEYPHLSKRGGRGGWQNIRAAFANLASTRSLPYLFVSLLPGWPAGSIQGKVEQYVPSGPSVVHTYC
jgi:hypothetical protein